MDQPEQGSTSFLPDHNDFENFWDRLSAYLENLEQMNEAPELDPLMPSDSGTSDQDATVISSYLDLATSPSGYNISDAELTALLEYVTYQNPPREHILSSLAELRTILEAQYTQPNPAAYKDVCRRLDSILDTYDVLESTEQTQVVSTLHLALFVQQLAVEWSVLSQPDRFAYQMASGHLATIAKKASDKITSDELKLEAIVLYASAQKAFIDIVNSWGINSYIAVGECAPPTDPINPMVNEEPTYSPSPQVPLDSIPSIPELTDARLPPSRPATAVSPQEKAMEMFKQSFCGMGSLTRALSLPVLPSSISDRSRSPHQPFKAFPRGNNLHSLPGIKE